jgi:hypothetical protein
LLELARAIAFVGSLSGPGLEAAAGLDAPPPSPTSQVLHATVVPNVVLRGDYGHPDAVLVGLAGGFASTAQPLLTALARVGRVQVLVQRGAGS